jgi:ribonuclease E
MTVIDVNTGKFTGTQGNLEATVTRNNLEAAEEIVRQLRLRDIGGIIVIDFIDMVLPATATCCCAVWSSAWAATAPATRSPR